MKVRRYIAANSREALARARTEIGADAVVLSSRQTGSGFELLALAKNDIAALVSAGPEQPAQAPPQPTAGTAHGTVSATRQPGASARSVTPRLWQPNRAEPAAAQVSQPPQPPPPASATPATQLSADALLLNEIRTLRSIVEEQGASMAWAQDSHAHPVRSALLREVIAAGFSPVLARAVAEAVPADLPAAPARQWLARMLARNVLCGENAPDPVASGGVYALVGPTGVGKTTTVAKLAAGCVVRHGAASLGLISADHYRIGAQDQLRIYGRILGVAVHSVHDAESLGAALAALGDKRLVLIDSIGVGQRDERVAEQSALFDELHVGRILLLSAASQAQTLEEVVQAYDAKRLRGTILTKTDEAVALGGALDCAIRHRLRVSHITNGQRVPEDIHAASASYLVHRALSVERAPVFQMQRKELDLLACVPQRVVAPAAAHAAV
jgi:flagellar biosynthesis protein FlhF